MTDDLLATLVAGINEALPEAASLRRAIHADPHLSGDESDTRAAVTSMTPWLDWSPIAETGAFAHIGPAGPSIALRAELDALPITEDTGVAWASQRRGIMHACGHDVHLAALWALMSASKNVELPAAMVPLLQPREESNPPGATEVVASGFLDDQDVRAIMGVHVQPQIERGLISASGGAVNAAFDSFEITVSGRGGHGAYPHIAIDPISILAAIVTGLSGITGREVNPIHPAVLSFGSFQSGTAPNVIPDVATCTGTIRTFNEKDRSFLHDAVTRLVEGTAMAHGAAAKVTFTRGGPLLFNNDALADYTQDRLEGVGIKLTSEAFRSCGSDDFSEYSQLLPAMMSFVGTGTVDGVGLHHARFLPGRDALRLTAITMAASYVAACDALRDGKLDRPGNGKLR